MIFLPVLVRSRSYTLLDSSSGVTSSLNAERAGLKDVLVIISSYPGDRLNFGLAIEKALASSTIRIESVVAADDVSHLRPHYDFNSRSRLVGARGLVGKILVCKIFSTLVERGESLARIKQMGDAVVGSLASLGAGLEHCHVPGRGLDIWGRGRDETGRAGV